MKQCRNLQQAIATAVVLIIVSACAANDSKPFVSPIFGEHMVLQRGKPNTMWGWTEPGKKVRVKIGAKQAVATAGKDGKWVLKIQPPKAGGPYTLTIDGPQHVEWTDILVGDVWLCTGQSNMEMGIGQAFGGPEEIKAADQHRTLRLCVVEDTVAYAPHEVVDAAWRTCASDTLGAGGWAGFSAVGYFFGCRLQEEVDVPIGLIQNCWGGTAAECWTSAESLRPFKVFDATLEKEAHYLKQGAPEYGFSLYHWIDENDAGLKGETWFSADLDDDDWKKVALPDAFEELGVPEAPAICYFRTTVDLPDPLPAGEAHIRLGNIEKLDLVKINGREVGSDTWEWNFRNYAIGPDILKPGKNVVAVRVFKTAKDGGFLAKPEEMKLVLGDGTDVSLADGWKGKLSVDTQHFAPADYAVWPTMPSVLYNGMIKPVAPLAITGAIWYQGEANAGRAAQYRKLLPTMIGDWRSLFDQGDFPFYIVSLAAFMDHRDQPGDDAWAEIREAQDQVAQTIENSGLAVAIDVGDAKDIHPRDKKTVGDRLGRVALANHYGKKIVCSGPRFVSAKPVAGGALRIQFDHTDGGLVVKGDKLGEFSVCGDDGKWVWADAKIDGDTVVVSSKDVPHPKHVRYAWQSNPEATLYNGAGLPAIPFRSDAPK